MDSSWCSLNSLESLMMPSTPTGLPGIDPGPVPKKARMSQSEQENSLPMETASVYNEHAAHFQSLQAIEQPYQPGTEVIQPPKQPPPRANTDRRMYIPDLDQAITHRDVFNFFSSFGDLERVCVRGGTDNLNYAMVVFSRACSMEQAIKSNPHLIKGYRLNCRKAKKRHSNKGSQKKPKSTKSQPPKAPAMQAIQNDDNRTGHQALEKYSKPTLHRWLPLQKLVKHNSINPVTARNTDKTYVYAVTMQDKVSRWSFTLSESSPSSDEMRALEKGLSRSAKLLLSMWKKLNAVSYKHAKPEVPKWPQNPTSSASSKAVPIEAFKVPSPPPAPPTPPASPAPPAPPASDPVLPTLPLLLTFTPQVPLPKLDIPAIVKPDLRSAVLSSLGENYVHHCYTNVEAYRRTKSYVDLLPCEMLQRPSIRKYLDQMYARKE